MNRTKRSIALLLALIMCISFLPTTFAQAGVEGEQEYVINLSAFNTSNMKESLTNYKTTPVIRKLKNELYFKDAMDWSYEVPAEYAADGVAFKAMNLEETAPWKLEGYKAATDPSPLSALYLALEFETATYGTDAPAYAAFRLKAEAGTYDLYAKAENKNDAAVPAV